MSKGRHKQKERPSKREGLKRRLDKAEREQLRQAETLAPLWDDRGVQDEGLTHTQDDEQSDDS